MEALVVLTFLLGLAGCSLRWAHDSRDGLRSSEQRLAGFGFTWRDRFN